MLSIITLSDIMLSVIMLDAFKLNIILQNVIMLRVEAPNEQYLNVNKAAACLATVVSYVRIFYNIGHW
jgi:hypothetical protein